MDPGLSARGQGRQLGQAMPCSLQSGACATLQSALLARAGPSDWTRWSEQSEATLVLLSLPGATGSGLAPVSEAT